MRDKTNPKRVNSVWHLKIRTHSSDLKRFEKRTPGQKQRFFGFSARMKTQSCLFDFSDR